MKRIITIIRPDKLEDVKQALEELKYPDPDAIEDEFEDTKQY